jgi:diacylglycerol O-acyltransferase / wax synthase
VARGRALARAARLAGGALRPGAATDAVRALESLARPAPATGLDRSATRERAVAFGTVPLDAAREAGRRHDATVNDVLLAASALALGRALRRRGERPVALRALVPVDVRTGAAGALGNRISFLAIDLPVGEPDPSCALRIVRARTAAAKRDGEAAPLDALARAADVLPPTARRLLARTAARVAGFNAVVANVPGPPVALELLGRPLTAVHPMVPLLHGHAVSIGAVSYGGRLCLGLAADAEVAPDVRGIARDLERAFDALRIAGDAGAETPWRARARARRQRAANR